EGAARVFAPPTPEGESGDSVTVTGWSITYTDAENGEQLVQLTSMDGVQYYVEGLELGGSETGVGSRLVITGTLGEQLGPRSWRLTAGSAEPHSGATQIECQTGRLERLADGAYLVLDDGETRYPVPDAPEALEDGARIELCAEQFEAGKAVRWMHIASPPSSEVPMSGGGSGRSVTAVGIAPTVTAPEAPVPAEPGTATAAYPASVTESGTDVAQTVGAASTEMSCER